MKPHRELYSIFSNNLQRKRTWRGIHISVCVFICVCAQSSSRPVWLFVTPRAPLSMRFYQQEYWSVLPFLPPGDLSPRPRNWTHISHISCIASRFYCWAIVEAHLYKCTTHKPVIRRVPRDAHVQCCKLSQLLHSHYLQAVEWESLNTSSWLVCSLPIQTFPKPAIA